MDFCIYQPLVQHVSKPAGSMQPSSVNVNWPAETDKTYMREAARNLGETMVTKKVLKTLGGTILQNATKGWETRQ